MYYDNITQFDWDNESPTLINNKNADIERLSAVSSKKVKIYFDMDGVIAKFNKGAPMEEVFSPGYFLNLDPIKKGLNLLKYLIEDGTYDIYIASKSSYIAIEEKKAWLKKYIPQLDENHIFLIPLNANKANYIMDQDTSILIDDYNPNLESWKGIPIKFLNGINSHNSKFLCINKHDIPALNAEKIHQIITAKTAELSELEYVD